ncbi:solute carrier family 2 member 11, like isoform X3 [Sparus aurata]|uniref:Solute carrier family 2 member 11, like n=1 Tax=Sparus aurata TaxID=8175 RepID=A0A671YAI0_SPAAU|nr:solute carrier family 2, facilitated glucose transporter member 9-like isoform X3 [Sparus aurata]
MPQFLTLLLECPLVIVAIFVTGIGGTFQYGFCVSVMTSPSDFIKELVNKTCLHRYGVSLDKSQVSLIWSFTVSIFCLGGLLGTLVAGPLITTFGRKPCLLLNNLLAIIGAVLMLFSQTAMSFEMIMAGRFLYGINSGVSLSVHPIYIIECTPKRLRLMVGVTIASCMSFGKFSGQLLGISELLGTEERWPWLLGFNGFAALLQLSTLPFLPESPRFLLLDKGDHQACEKALSRLWGNKDHSMEVEEMLQEKAALQNVRSHSVMELIRDQSVRWQLITIIFTFTPLQLCGINAFMTIENTGKKVLLFRGYAGMSATLILLTITLYLQTHISWMPYCSMVLIFIFIFFFAGGPAGATAPLPGEIFTQSFKSAGYTIACTINWAGLFVLGMVFPILVEKLDYFCFLIFLCFCVVCGLYVWFNVPETKNRTALEIAAEFRKMHSKPGEPQREINTKHEVNKTQTNETKF